jgi:hypothetical protein
MLRAYRQRHLDVTKAEYTQAVVTAFHNAAGAQLLRRDDSARRQNIQLIQVYDTIDFARQSNGHGAFAFAAQFRQTAMQWRLPAFKARSHAVASVLAFLAARRGLAVTAADAATNTLLSLARALSGPEIRQC